MPKRKSNKKEGKRVAYSYEDLLLRIRTAITDKYGSLAKFIASDDFDAMGFEKNQAQKFYTYLSLPKEGVEKKTKSFATIQALFKGILEVELDSEIVTTRTMTIFAEKEIS